MAGAAVSPGVAATRAAADEAASQAPGAEDGRPPPAVQSSHASDPVAGPHRRHPSHEQVAVEGRVVGAVGVPPEHDPAPLHPPDTVHQEAAVGIDGGPDLARPRYAPGSDGHPGARRDGRAHARTVDGDVESRGGGSGTQDRGARRRLPGERGGVGGTGVHGVSLPSGRVPRRAPGCHDGVVTRGPRDTGPRDTGPPDPVPGEPDAADAEFVGVGGVRVRVEGPAGHREVVARRFGRGGRTVGLRPPGRPDVRLVLDPDPGPVPETDPDAVVQNVRVWHEGAVTLLGAHRGLAEIRGTGIRIGAPAGDDLERSVLDSLCQFAVALALVTPRRALVHGAVVARGDAAVLLVGPSGRGKSTAALAALESGWELLGDDLAVVRRDGGTPVPDPGSAAGSGSVSGPWLVEGVRRPVAVPADMLDGLALRERSRPVATDAPAGPGVVGGSGAPTGRDPGGVTGRARRELPLDVLGRGPRRLVGVVVVDHDRGEGLLQELATGSLDAVVGALATVPTAPVLRRHLPVLSAVASLPAHRLAHAASVGHRRRRAGEMLEELATRLGLPAAPTRGEQR